MTNIRRYVAITLSSDSDSLDSRGHGSFWLDFPGSADISPAKFGGKNAGPGQWRKLRRLTSELEH